MEWIIWFYSGPLHIFAFLITGYIVLNGLKALWERLKSSPQTPQAMLIERNNHAPPPPPPRAPVLPGSEPRWTHFRKLQGWASTRVDSARFMIEYRDEYGDFSCRRITAKRIAHNRDGRGLLVAHCHERNAERSFRIDRIQCCIDADGVAHENVNGFLADTLGAAAMDGRTGLRKQTGRWEQKRDLVRPHAQILTALALADGQIHDREFAVIVSHCADIGERHALSFDTDGDRLARYVSRLKPDLRNLTRAINTVAACPESDRMALLEAATLLIKVDGVLAKTELDFLEDLRMRLRPGL